MEGMNTKPADEAIKIVVFRLGDEEFGVDISQVNRIIKMDAITRVPNTPPYILGVLNLRGGIIVIVDLALKLGFHTKRFDRNTRIIDIEVGKTVVGMVVDSATELLTITKDSIQPAPSMILKKVNGDYITGVAIIDQRILILLDLTKVLNSDEIVGISAIGTPEKKNNSVVHPLKPETPRATQVSPKPAVASEVPQPRHEFLFIHPAQAGDLPQHPF